MSFEEFVHPRCVDDAVDQVALEFVGDDTQREFDLADAVRQRLFKRNRNVLGQRFRFQFVLRAALQHRMHGQREHQEVESDQCPDQPETQGAWRRIKTERDAAHLSHL